MDDGALDHALEAGRRLHIGLAAGADDGCQFVLDEIVETVAKLVDIDIACRQDLQRVAVLGQREQQMFERREFVTVR